MLNVSYVHPIRTITARDFLTLWLMTNSRGMSYCQENGQKLADMFPGFVDVSFLMDVWKELADDE